MILVSLEFFAICIILRILIDYTIFNNTTFETILDNLIATSIVMVFIHFVINFIKLPEMLQIQESKVMPKNIRAELQKAARNTDEWTYVGNTANYVRNKIYPILAEQATNNDKNIKIKIIILDPNNQKLCEDYAKYRKNNRSNKVSNIDWNYQYVQAQLIATLIKTIHLHKKGGLVTCELAFSNHFSQFRYDFSHDDLIITFENPQEPALHYSRGSVFFDKYQRECTLKWQQSIEQEIENFEIDETITEASIKSFMETYFKDINNVDIQNLIYEAVTKNKSLYG